MPTITSGDEITVIVDQASGVTIPVPSTKTTVVVPAGETNSVDLIASGPQGPPGAGIPGAGVPAGGADGQVLAKSSGTDYATEWVNPPTGGGGAGAMPLGVRLVRGAATYSQNEVTTGNGSGNPYTRGHFANWTFHTIDTGTTELITDLELVTATDAYGFDVVETGIYQASLEVGYTFDTPPEAVHWYIDTYNEYFEFMSTPTLGWGAAIGNNGGSETFMTPPFYEAAWDEDDGTYYIGARADWRGIGMTMGSAFGGGIPNVRVRLFRLG